MKVYACIPKKSLPVPHEKTVSVFRNSLFDFLKKYYKNPEIEITSTQDISASVYIMGEPIYGGYEDEISKTISDIVKQNFGVLDVNTRLNYAKLNPNLMPGNISNVATSKTETPAHSDLNRQTSAMINPAQNSKSNEFDYEKLSQNYQSELPRFSFDQVILSPYTRKCIEEAIGIIEVESKVFDEWGLRSIIPIASTALSFYGPPGTGKTMAAEAVAHKMGRKILIATYADI